MKELDEDMIYDAMSAISENSKPLSLHINGITDLEQRRALSKAYTDGVYAPAIRLQLLLSEAAMARGKQRHAKIEAEVRAYFQGQKANPADQTPPSGGRLHPVVGQSICPVCDKPIEENEISSTGYIDYHKECNLVDGNFNEEIK